MVCSSKHCQSVSHNNEEARPGTNKCGIASQPSYPTVSASLGAESYATEWEEFQAAQDTGNGEIPQVFKDAVELVKAHNAPNATYKRSYTGPFAAMDNAEYKKVSGYKPRSSHGDLPKAGCVEGGHQVEGGDLAVLPMKKLKEAIKLKEVTSQSWP